MTNISNLENEITKLKKENDFLMCKSLHYKKYDKIFRLICGFYNV